MVKEKSVTRVDLPDAVPVDILHEADTVNPDHTWHTGTRISSSGSGRSNRALLYHINHCYEYIAIIGPCYFLLIAPGCYHASCYSIQYGRFVIGERKRCILCDVDCCCQIHTYLRYMLFAMTMVMARQMQTKSK